jgi:hypothetical protein
LEACKKFAEAIEQFTDESALVVHLIDEEEFIVVLEVS